MLFEHSSDIILRGTIPVCLSLASEHGFTWVPIQSTHIVSSNPTSQYHVLPSSVYTFLTLQCYYFLRTSIVLYINVFLSIQIIGAIKITNDGRIEKAKEWQKEHPEERESKKRRKFKNSCHKKKCWVVIAHTLIPVLRW